MNVSSIPLIGNIYNKITQNQSSPTINNSSTPLKSDSFTSNPLLATNPTNENDKKAGFGQRLMNNFGNAFGKMADLVGLGTISHYAKSNFQANDANKSNSLDTNEFSAISQMIGKSFQQVDGNSNQEISLGEFKKIIGDIVDSDFKTADTNDDGFLNMNEANTGGYVVTNGSNNSIKAHDLNNDNLLSKNEFTGLVNDMKLRKK